MRPGLEPILARALASHQAGQLAQAERHYREALGVDPANGPALHGLGLLAMQAGHVAAAQELLGRAAAATPGDPGVLNNWGIALARLGRTAAARERFESAIALAPRFPDALVNLGSVLADLGELAAAQSRLREALAITPQSADARCALARVLLSQRKPAAAEGLLREVLLGKPAHAVALNLLGNALREQGRLPQALECYRLSQAARPDHPEAWSNFLVAQNADPSVSALEAFEAHRAFGRRFEPPQPFPGPSLAARRPGRLRIGYVSADFRAHALAAFVEPVFTHHDRSRFEIAAYSNTPAEDVTTARMRAIVERFVPVAGLSDAQLVERIRADGVDVLVDLSGHTAGNRLLAFVRRAAPVQVTWLGYPNTTGLSSMDFRLTDARADPPGAESLHTEQLVRLPTAWCYRPWTDAPAVAARRADPGAIVFGVMNNPAKSNDVLFDAWARLVAGLPGSRMLMHAPDDEGCRARTIKAFAAAGVDVSRIDFFPRLATAGYLSRYAEVDIALDSHPCAGATTTLDALWMGVPVVTLAGDRPYGRSGASILGTLGLDDWVATTLEDYIACASAHARDPHGLETLRRDLRERLRASVLMDGAAMARALESAFERIARGRGFAESNP
ncbi:MAG: tetratricopeptide repeat protein [Betaproteobacteria bacterium]|nr:tetratricopeptide repeat protein [Betaproteobacteria bacterium]